MSGEQAVVTCVRCYSANPEVRQRVATLPIRHVAIDWRADEVADHDALAAISRDRGISVASMIKSVVRRLLGKDT